jgi:hypothetical protein
VCLVSQDDGSREGNARASENNPKEQDKRGGDAAASGGVVTAVHGEAAPEEAGEHHGPANGSLAQTPSRREAARERDAKQHAREPTRVRSSGLGGALPAVPPLPHIPPPALPGSRAWVEHAAYTQREGAQNGPAANGERTGDCARDARDGDGENGSGSKLPATRPAIAFRLGAAAPNAPSKGGSTDGVALREGDAGRAESGCQGGAGAGAWSGWRDDGEEKQAGAGDVTAADGGGSVRPGGEGQGRAGVESGEEIQRKLREQALKSMLLARAKGSSAGDRCAALRMSTRILQARCMHCDLSGVPRHFRHFVLSSLSGRKIK